jgi:hypothetical protein
MLQKLGVPAWWAGAVLFAISLSGQTTGTGTLVGTITDSSGALVAGAKVTTVNAATAFTSEVPSSQEGAYYIPYLTSRNIPDYGGIAGIQEICPRRRSDPHR